MNIQEIKNAFDNHKIGYVLIKNYTNRYGKVSDIKINVGYVYSNLIKQDIQAINNDVIEFVSNGQFDKKTFDIAKNKIKQSLISPNTNRSKGQKKVYIPITNNGAVQWYTGNESTGSPPSLKLRGLVEKEIIHQEGNYPVVNSRPKTIAKNKIKKQLKTGKIRTYNFNRMDKVSVNGDKIYITLPNR